MDKDYLLEKWLKGELSEQEMVIFMAQSDFKLNTKIVQAANEFKASGYSKPEDFETFKNSYHTSKSEKKSRLFSPSLLRIAALLIITLGLYFTFIYDPISQYKTLAGEQETIELPDHSKVQLNASSELTFYASNWEDKRSVQLNGEAFFEVAKGNTFDVLTSLGKVTVVGTAFNVKNRDNYFEVKCYEGAVKVVSDAEERTLYAGATFQIINGNFKERNTSASQPH